MNPNKLSKAEMAEEYAILNQAMHDFMEQAQQLREEVAARDRLIEQLGEALAEVEYETGFVGFQCESSLRSTLAAYHEWKEEQ